MTGGVPMTTVTVAGIVLHAGPPLPAASVSHALNWKVSVTAELAVFVVFTTADGAHLRDRQRPDRLRASPDDAEPVGIHRVGPCSCRQGDGKGRPSPTLTVWLFGVGAVSTRLTKAPGWNVGAVVNSAVVLPGGVCGVSAPVCAGPGAGTDVQPVSRQLERPTPGAPPKVTLSRLVVIVNDVVLMIPMPAVPPLVPAVVNAVAAVAKAGSVNVMPVAGAVATFVGPPAAVVAALMVMLVAVPGDVVTAAAGFPGQALR